MKLLSALWLVLVGFTAHHLRSIAVFCLLAGFAAFVAMAGEVAKVAGQGKAGGVWSFTLYNEAGACGGVAYKRAVYRQTKPDMEVEGCWIEREDSKVWMIFVDGDEYVIPRSAFKDGA